MVSERDRLLGALLALEQAQRELHDRQATPPEPQVLARILRRLQRGARVLEMFPELGYGLPGWTTGTVETLLGDLRGEGGVWVQALAAIAAKARRTTQEELDEIELLELALGEQPPMPPAVRAAIHPVDDDALSAATTRSGAATAVRGPLGFEADWRHRRTDVVLYGRSAGRSAVVGLDIEFDDLSARASALAPEAKQLEESFHQGVVEGHRAALYLLAELGLPENAARILAQEPIATLPSALPPYRIRDRSAGLPVALATLREASRLTAVDLGPPRRMASGSFVESRGESNRWVLETMPADVAAGKLAGIRIDGRADALIAPAANVDGVLDARTLSAAAELAWGPAWREWTRDLVDGLLAEKGYRIARGSRGLASAGAAPEVTEVVADSAVSLARLISEAREPFVGILGGPPSSGKSTVARQVAERMKARGREALWVALPADAAITADDLLPDLKRLLRPMSGEVLVILEDLERRMIAHGAIDELLLALVEELEIPILAIARYDDAEGPRWRADRVVDRRAISGHEEVARFAERLLATNPDLAPAAPWRAAALAAAAGDLWVLTEFLRWAASNAIGDEPPIAEHKLVERFLRERFASLDGEQRQEMRTIAALSLVGVGRGELSTLSPPDVALLGGRLESGEWRLRSRWVAHHVVKAATGDFTRKASPAAVERDIAALLRNELDPLLRDAGATSSARRIARILAGADRYSHALLGLLWKEYEDRIVYWSATADPAVVAALLNRDGLTIRRDSRRTIARNLCQATISPMSPLTLRDLAAVLSALVRYADDLDDPRAGLIDPLEESLREVLPTVLTDREGMPAHRQRLLRAMLRFRFPNRASLVQPNVTGFLRDLDPRRSADYRVARGTIELLLEQREAWYRTADLSEIFQQPDEDADESRATFEGDPERALLDLAPDLMRMLDEPAPNAPVGVWLGWLGLCNALRHDPNSDWGKPDWNELVDLAADAVRGGVAKATLDGLWRALAGLNEYDRGLCVRLLNRAELGPVLVERFAAAGTFGQRAQLISTLRNVHAMTARNLLYEGSEPRDALARRFAGMARTVDDIRGVGLFLKAVADVDETYGSASQGFAHLFAEQLGSNYLHAHLRQDERTALLFHLVEGLARAQATFVGDAVDVAVARIENTIRRTPKGWAPQLALTLGRQQSNGSAVLRQLAEGLGIDKTDSEWEPPFNHILRMRLRTTMDPQALLHFHRLAAALEPGHAPFARAFLDDYAGETIQQITRPGHPEVVAEATAVVTRTLQRAGESNPARLVLEALSDGGWDWARELRRARDAAWMTETLDHLRRLNPRVARALTEELVDPGPTEGSISFLARRVFDSRGAEPHSAVSIVSAATRAAPEVAPMLLDQLRSRQRAWSRLEDDLRYVQDPIAQARAYTALGRAGWEPTSRTIERVWNERWSTGIRWLRNPRSITALMSLFAAWPDGDRMLQGAVVAVRDGFVISRIQEGAASDLEATPRLISSLRLAGAPDVAQEVVAATTPADFARRAPLRTCAAMLSELRALEHATGLEEMTPVLIARLRDQVSASPVVDPTEHWLSIGTLAHVLGWNAISSPGTQGEVRPSTLHPKLVGPTLWGIGWLPPSPWRDAVLAEAIATGRAGTGINRPWALAASLSVLSAHGRTAEAATWSATWERAASAHPWVLCVLLRQARSDSELRSMLLSWSGALTQNLRTFGSGWYRLDPAAQEARESWRTLLSSAPSGVRRSPATPDLGDAEG